MSKNKKDKSTKTEIQIFCYKSMPVRTIETDGEAWFVGKDVAEILGYRRTADALRVHVDEEDKGVCDLPTPGGNQINESGLYSLILSSKLPSAKKFKHWVTHEVLPEIRKTGSYAMLTTKKEKKPDLCLPAGSVELAETIIKLAHCANSDEDFETLAAMDNLFKDFTGKSALNAAGMFIMAMPQIDSVEQVYNQVITEGSYHYKLMGSSLPPLPKSWTDEQTVDD